MAVTLTTLFAVTAVLLFAALYTALRAELAGEIVERVDETLDALAAVDRNKGFDDLTAVVASESDSVRDADTIFLLIGLRSTPGNGLGLALVAAVSEVHEAKIQLSDNNPGLKVVIDFPPPAH